MPTERLKIYIGCSLTHAPSGFKSEVANLKNLLQKDYDVLEFLGTEKGTPTDVYHWDIRTCLADCDLFVAMCDYPAIGLGYELGAAVEAMRKPVLALAHDGTHVSRLLSGIDAPNYTFERYSGWADIPNLIQQKITQANL